MGKLEIENRLSMNLKQRMTSKENKEKSIMIKSLKNMENFGDMEDSEDDLDSSHSSSDDENMFRNKFGFLSIRSL